MSAKKTVMDLMLERFDRLEQKVDDVTIHAMPSLLEKVAVLITDSKKENQFRSRIYGGIMLMLTMCSIGVAALAYLKK